MGRRDAVQVILEIVARCRALVPGLVVTYEPGWETRGNGTSANYGYGSVHHTASASSLLRPFPTQGILRDGRVGLTGPLCNFAGPACSLAAPRLHVMAAHPANHAGASKASGPVPKLSLFNPQTLGLEIDYAGSTAMLPGQLVVAQAWSRAVADVVGGGDIERIRAHAETSITGKWDPGYAPGKTLNMADFRRASSSLSSKNLQEEDEMTPGQEAALDQARNNSIAANENAGEARRLAGAALDEVRALSALVRSLPASSGSAGAGLSYAALATAIVAEQDRVARDGDPKTGPTT